jgi:hypothetical protein
VVCGLAVTGPPPPCKIYLVHKHRGWQWLYREHWGVKVNIWKEASVHCAYMMRTFSNQLVRQGTPCPCVDSTHLTPVRFAVYPWIAAVTQG